MQLFKTLLAAAVFAASFAQADKLKFTSFPPATVDVGKAVTITWTGGDASAPVTIKLRKGASKDLHDVDVLTSSATGGSFTWTPKKDLVDGSDYALEIDQAGSEPNYTGLFAITGGAPAGSQTTATSTISLSSKGPTTTEEPKTTTHTHVSVGTTTTMARNTTVVIPTLTSTQAVTVTPTNVGTTPSTPKPTPTGAGATLFASPITLLLGVAAAFFYLY